MMCPAKLILTEDSFEVQEEKCSVTWLCGKYTLDERLSIFIRDNPIFSSERMLHKDYYCKSSVERISSRGSQGV
jgi:hypothetical protein